MLFFLLSSVNKKQMTKKKEGKRKRKKADYDEERSYTHKQRHLFDE